MHLETDSEAIVMIISIITLSETRGQPFIWITLQNLQTSIHA